MPQPWTSQKITGGEKPLAKPNLGDANFAKVPALRVTSASYLPVWDFGSRGNGLNLDDSCFRGGTIMLRPIPCTAMPSAKEIRVSLATIYNTLQQFTSAGLLRRLAIDGQKTWYDTNMSEHYHFFCEDDNCVFDIADGQVSISQMPAIPPGMEIARVEVVVRLKRR